MEALAARADVVFELFDNDFSLVDGDDAVLEVERNLRDAMTAAVRRHCFATGQVPHPLVDRVVEAMIETVTQTLEESPECGSLAEAFSQTEGCTAHSPGHAPAPTNRRADR